jgi:cell division protein FtsQ
MKRVWRILKKILTIAFTLSCAALFIAVLTSAVQKQKELTCKSLKVKIDYESGLAFINESEIRDRINFLSGECIIGRPLSKIDFHTLEKEIEKNPYVSNAEIFVDRQQNVIIDIIQKRPILRVINSDEVSYYISEKNDHMPLNDNFTVRVPVALGYIATYHNESRDSAVQDALYKMTTFIGRDVFLHALIDQMYVNENGEFDLIPKTGNHTIHFGSATENMNDKFKRLKIFYHDGLTKTGWYKYSTINLKFDGQVVCEKRDSAQSTGVTDTNNQ